MNKIKFSHTNLIASDWRVLAQFYIDVFKCIPVGATRHLSGQSVAEGTGLTEPEIEGVHLRLPDCGRCGPTLEIFQYRDLREESQKFANSRGFTHIAFEVDDLDALCAEVVKAGGVLLGRLASQKVEGEGICTFVYVRDPERNIIELQSWS